MLLGRSDAAIGELVGRCRQTVNGWRREPRFAAALNARRHALFAEQEDRLRGLLPKALDVLEQQLERGNATVALAILARAQLTVPPAGPADPDEIEAEQRHEAFVAAWRTAVGQTFAGDDA